MRAVGVIPARWASSRFPGKPLAALAGRPMIERVWERARQAKRLRAVLVATDDARIARACESFGAPVVMTRAAHASGSDRVGEVAEALEDEIVVNIQGDEPLLEGFVIDAAVEALHADPEAGIGTVAHALAARDRDDPNRVKVVVDARGRALSFSRRMPRPDSAAGDLAGRCLQHVGLYAYRRPVLLELLRQAPTADERAQGLEQLRALAHGIAIATARVEGWRGVPVDVPADLVRVEALLRGSADARRPADAARC